MLELTERRSRRSSRRTTRRSMNSNVLKSRLLTPAHSKNQMVKSDITKPETRTSNGKLSKSMVNSTKLRRLMTSTKCTLTKQKLRRMLLSLPRMLNVFHILKLTKHTWRSYKDKSKKPNNSLKNGTQQMKPIDQMIGMKTRLCNTNGPSSISNLRFKISLRVSLKLKESRLKWMVPQRN